MGSTFSRVKTWLSAQTLTAADLNAEFDNVLNNLTPAGLDDESASDVAMQAVTDPYPGSVISKPTSLTGELQRIRYMINQIIGKTYWYEDKGGSAQVVNTTLPAFLVTPAAEQTNIAVGSVVTVVWGTEIKDQAGNFASNAFTAPVTGLYHFDIGIRLQDMDAASGYYILILFTSNREYRYIYDVGHAADFLYQSLVLSCLADMDAADVARVQILQAAGTQQTDIATTSWFSGHLVC